MSKMTTIALISVGAGILLCLLSYVLVGGKWTGYNSRGNEYVQMDYESSTGISKVSIDETANTVILKSDDTDRVLIEYSDDPEKPEYVIKEEDGKLKFEKNSRNSFKLFNIDFSRRDITVTLPKDYKGELEVDLTSGEIDAKDVTASDIKMDNTTGSIKLENIESLGDVRIENTTGEIVFENLKSGGDIKLENTTGSIEGTIEGSEDDYSIKTEVTTGDCNLSDSKGGSKKLDVEITTGSIEIGFTK